ncbi:type 2 isopentenyl-diphosphate Delta-isomerase [Sporosalibacterium faouarense]|uniref:type 2 isopentenyl-diphosphate Delta-isomerase n=1 Tax=Sporosalibacterium faouarense TaxID=516123 RepID=UPI00192C6124
MDGKKINPRKLRKKQHIEMFLKTSSNNSTGFEDIILENNSLPEMDFDTIDTSCTFLGKKLDYPIIINAITGGFDEGIKINLQLARLAKRYNLAMAVGSQTIAIDSSEYKSFEIVREVMEDKVVIGNLSANSPYKNVLKAIEMIEADGIQLHLNVPQEMCMKEGDRNFKGILSNIKYISENTSVPVIVKEVGFGMSKKVAEKLFDVGINYIDIGGKGGTNFIAIEDERDENMDFSEFHSWGIPTAESLIKCREISRELNIITSGGITKAEEIVKSLCLGSKMIGISGIILRKLIKEGYESAERFLNDLLYKVKMIMIFVGSETIDELQHIPVIIGGELKNRKA